MPTLDELAAEMQDIVFAHFDTSTAWRLGCLIREKGDAGKLAIATEITLAGHLLFAAALPGATPDNTEWIRRKRNTVMRFHQSSLAMRLLCEAKGKSLAERYGLSETDYVASGGGVPILIRGGACVGAVVVSGLPDVEDHRLVVEAMREILASPQG
ncbi:heme-degrading domain-containing protein [Aureimonas psammosilenae]|uniref:heme-degrading domain-containing protein n=1 Tax=Aureimonas psammosilenae TaxID=2495496 RepID=UPI001F18583B|nr:heme-degrading domain-containing protein [Aureimonas psammosilenae]